MQGLLQLYKTTYYTSYIVYDIFIPLFLRYSYVNFFFFFVTMTKYRRGHLFFCASSHFTFDNLSCFSLKETRLFVFYEHLSNV